MNSSNWASDRQPWLFRKLNGWPFYQICPMCGGSGKRSSETMARYGDEPYVCDMCDGTGFSPRYGKTEVYAGWRKRLDMWLFICDWTAFGCCGVGLVCLLIAIADGVLGTGFIAATACLILFMASLAFSFVRSYLKGPHPK